MEKHSKKTVCDMINSGVVNKGGVLNVLSVARFKVYCKFSIKGKINKLPLFLFFYFYPENTYIFALITCTLYKGSVLKYLFLKYCSANKILKYNHVLKAYI